MEREENGQGQKVKEPIPLSTPEGRVLAYACPTCQRVTMSVICADRDREAEHSRESAARCCVCRECGGPKNQWLSLYCELCQAAREAAFHAELPARQAENARIAVAQEATFARSVEPDLAWMLARRMSDISEDYYCAGWMHGTEHALWRMVQGGHRSWGMGDVTEDEVAELQRLSEKAGGWIRYDDDLGEVFVPMAEWLASLPASLEGDRS